VLNKTELVLEKDENKATDWEWLARLLDSDDEVRRRLGISISWSRPSKPQLRISNRVGTVVFRDRASNKTLSIKIAPKVQGSVSGMLRAVLLLDRTLDLNLKERQTSYSDRPCAWLASIFLSELERFLSSVRPRGEEEHTEFTNKIRGQILVDQYLKRNYFERRNVIPCRYIEWTKDNLPNQILKYAVKVSRLALLAYREGSHRKLGLARRCDSGFTGVSDKRISPGDLIRVRSSLSGAFRHYRGIVHLARLVISALDPQHFESGFSVDMPVVKAFDRDINRDGSITWDLVDMPTLFEEYVRKISGSSNHRSRVYQISRVGSLPSSFDNIPDKPMKLDRSPIRVGDGMVLDAKYKVIGETLRPSASLDSEGWLNTREHQTTDLSTLFECRDSEVGIYHVSSNDLYQSVAYASHDQIRVGTSALVYPSTQFQSVGEIGSYRGLGFGLELDSSGVPVYILGARIDEKGIRSEVGGFGIRRNINAILSGELNDCIEGNS